MQDEPAGSKPFFRVAPGRLGWAAVGEVVAASDWAGQASGAGKNANRRGRGRTVDRRPAGSSSACASAPPPTLCMHIIRHHRPIHPRCPHMCAPARMRPRHALAVYSRPAAARRARAAVLARPPPLPAAPGGVHRQQPPGAGACVCVVWVWVWVWVCGCGCGCVGGRGWGVGGRDRWVGVGVWEFSPLPV